MAGQPSERAEGAGEDAAAAAAAPPTGLPAPLRERIVAWIADDPDPETRAELESLLTIAESPAASEGEPTTRSSDDPDAAAANAAAELAARFAGRLRFGTAGLRAALGAGPLRMNRLVVGQTAVGLGRFLLQRAAAAGAEAASAATPTIVIGYDARRGSARFARDSAELLAGLGLGVTLLPEPLPTPVLAFAVRALGADAGVMVTASHNPAADNGYKVYLGGGDHGAQIVPPTDAEIAAAIDAAAGQPLAAQARSDDYALADASVLEAYLAATASLAIPGPVDAAAAIAAPASPAAGPGDLAALPAWVYTPMHGVGGAPFLRLLRVIGARPPIVVESQFAPDAAFPTVAFPNPEEPGALDAAIATAEAAGAGLLLAHDPDADRLAVAVRTGDGAEGWERLAGNELGALLGWELAERLRAEGRSGLFATSLVSSPALGAVAAEYGLGYAETPTGFKWISRPADLAYGYEEALGYLVNPQHLSDKDGISAAVVALGLFARLEAAGVSFAEHRAAFARRFGRFASHQHSLRLPVPQIAVAMQALRMEPPTALGGLAIVSADDLLEARDGLSGSDILRYRLGDGTRLQLRPSGTEPKLKLYLDRGPDPVDAADDRLPLPELAARIAALFAIQESV